MRKKTVKGLVAEVSAKNIVLLTGDGEFIQVPVNGSSYSLGMEVEVGIPFQIRRPIFRSAACIAAALFIACFIYAIRPAQVAPEAYLALDINPSIVFSLDKNAVVIEAIALNPDGERILELIKVEESDILTVLDALLEAAYLQNYLSTGRDNVIIVSLAAPENFSIGETDLLNSMSKKLLKLKTDTYLKISMTGLGKVETARQMAISLNALLLGEEMKDMMRSEESRSLLEGSPPLPLWEFLQTVNPADIFSKDKFVTGEGQKDERKPDTPPQPKDAPSERDNGEDGEPGGDGEKPVIPKPPGPGGEQEIPNPNDAETPAP